MAGISNVKRLEKALDYLQNGEGIFLGKDVFLVENGLDGSDKCYGFGKVNGRIQAVTRECSDGFPVTDMDKSDLTYIFYWSAPNLFKKILDRKYKTIKYENI